jgi:UDP-sugar transporter A1/2/3
LDSSSALIDHDARLFVTAALALESMRNSVDRWASNRAFLVGTLMLTYSCQSLLITASKRKGDFAYNPSIAVFLAEVLKLMFALAMLPNGVAKLRFTGKVLLFALPALLYSLQNVLVFEALKHLAPPEYQLLNNMKLFTTTIVYRIVMRRQFSLLQWLAVVLLGMGMSLVSLKPEQSLNTERICPGVFIMVILSWCSAVAGVTNEWLIKGSVCIEANVWLYLFGSVSCALQMGSEGWAQLGSFQGFTTVTWLIVFCNAILGQSIAFLFKYADSIVKLYATSMSMLFTTVVSIFLFDFHIDVHMVLGCVASLISTCLFYLPTDILLAKDSELLGALQVQCPQPNGHSKSN